MNRLLVTGGAGFIGSNFIHYWMRKYPDDFVVVLDSLTYAGNKANLESVLDKANFVFVEDSICNQEKVEHLLREFQVDHLVHFAAESHVDRSISGPDAFIETNIIGTYSLLKAAKKVWIDEPLQNGQRQKNHRFHHVSTDEVYGTLGPNDPAFTENTPYAPNSPYSASKASSDHLVRAYHHTYGLNVTTSNCSNNYGQFHYPEKLIPLVITNILRNKELPIYGDGMQIRDWLHVEDHAYGIELALRNGRVGENYNIGGNNEWANVDIVKTICEIMEQEFRDNPLLSERFPLATSVMEANAESLIVYVEDRPGHDKRYAIDASKCLDELNYQPKESFESGIRKTIRWYLENENWWKPLLKD